MAKIEITKDGEKGLYELLKTQSEVIAYTETSPYEINQSNQGGDIEYISGEYMQTFTLTDLGELQTTTPEHTEVKFWQEYTGKFFVEGEAEDGDGDNSNELPAIIELDEAQEGDKIELEGKIEAIDEDEIVIKVGKALLTIKLEDIEEDEDITVYQSKDNEEKEKKETNKELLNDFISDNEITPEQLIELAQELQNKQED